MSGTVVISASYDKQIRWWDATTGRTVRCFTFQDSQVNVIHLVYQTRYLAVAGFNVIRLYDMNDINGSNIVGSQALQQQQQMATTASGGQTTILPPPIFSSYETQGSVNFTSLGSFPLLPRKTVVEERNLCGKIVDAADTDFSTRECERTVPFDFPPESGLLELPENHLSATTKDTRVILYATSEDGHIRFFDAKTPNVMCVLRDIATGAAITCSCLSPDSRCLLTGSQIGQVSVWHLPTIITSIAREQQQQWCLTASTKGAGISEAVSADTQEASERAAVLSRFGRRPVHEFALEGDYTSVRSISIDPLARWFVVATNQGKLHFFRFTHDISFFGTKFAKGIQSLSPRVCGESTQEALSTVLAGPHGSDNHEGNSSFFFRHHDGAELNNNSTVSQTIPLESVCRSAFVINEHNIHSKGSSDINFATRHRIPSAFNTQADNNASSCDCHGGITKIGVPLFQQLEPKDHDSSSRNIFSNSTTSHKLESRNDKVDTIPQRRTPSPGLPSASLAVTGRLQLALQKEMEIKEFYTFRAHYKYILKVSISPNGELLTTCCADYTVGRFIIPEIMRGRGRGIIGDTVQLLDLERKSHTIFPEQQSNSLQLNLEPILKNDINDNNHIKETVEKVFDPPICTGCVPASVRNSVDNPNTTGKLLEGRDMSREDIHGAGVGIQPLQNQQHQVADMNRVVATDDTPFSSVPHNKNTQQESLVLGKRSGATIGNISSADSNSLAAGFCVNSQLGDDGQLNVQKSENIICTDKQMKKHELDLYFKPLPPLTDHNRWVWDCVFSECSQFLFTVSSDCHVRMWNNITSDRPQSTVFVGHTKPVIAVLLAYNL